MIRDENITHGYGYPRLSEPNWRVKIIKADKIKRIGNNHSHIRRYDTGWYYVIRTISVPIYIYIINYYFIYRYI